jgi:uncharacterized protein
MKKLLICLVLLSPCAQAASPCYVEGMPLAQLTPCAEQGDAVAQRQLGMMYRQGDGVAKDYNQAFKWFLKAAEQGDAAAQTNLGIMYKEGSPVDFDENAAFNWFSKAAEQGDPIAQQNMGLMYAQGVIFPKDYALSYMWLNLSASQNNAAAIKFKDQLVKKMTSEQMTKALQLTNDWLSKHPKK